ncbi:MAG: CvpA family protein [Chitinophagaceae bacterium]|nr:CvpA family protein [Chitinophagaceae bacterium]
MIDIIFILIMVMAVIKGYSKGLIVALFSLVAFIAGLAAALKLSAVVSVSLQNNWHINSKWLPVLSFALVFIAVVVLVRLGAAFIKKTVNLVFLGWVDKLGGIFLYAIIYLMIYSVILFYAYQVHIVNADTASESKTFAFIYPFGPTVINGLGNVIPVFKNLFADLSRFFGSLSQHVT